MRLAMAECHARREGQARPVKVGVAIREEDDVLILLFVKEIDCLLDLLHGS